jgi:hypothetical protein
MGLTIIMLLLAVIAIWIAAAKGWGLLGALGGLFLALGLATIFPQFDVETIKAFNRWWNTTVEWAVVAFSDATPGSLTVGVLLMIIVGGGAYYLARKKGWLLLGAIGILLIFLALGTIFPHFLPKTGTAITDDAANFGYWATHAWVSPNLQ